MTNINPQESFNPYVQHPTGQPPASPQSFASPGFVQQPPPAKPQKVKRFGWPTVLLVAFGSWIIGFVMALLGGTDTTTVAEPAATVTATETVTAEPSAAPSSEPTKALAPKKTAKPAPAAATMGEGTYQIGVDAPAGRYKTVGEDSCYWERTKDDTGSFGSILANDNVNDGARASVTVKKGEFFTSSGCGTWKKV